jgi:hypothetical protein
MRCHCCIAVAIGLLGCGTKGAAEAEITTSGGPQATAGAAGEATEATVGQDGMSGGTGSAGSGELQQPLQIAPGQPSLSGVTSDGWAVFRDGDVLRAAAVGADSMSQEISKKPGSVLLRGNVVFNWAEVDWTLGVGDLSVWTAEAGTHAIGKTPYAEGLVAASHDGRTIVYTANATKKATNLLITPSDLSAPQVLIEAMGLGTEQTCGASIGFVGEHLFVGWCKVGSRAAVIERYDLVGDTWQATTIAEDALPAWSADETGENVFYQSSAYSGYVSAKGTPMLIDAGVAQGIIQPDGSAVLYSVGDQLRRSGLPDVNPVPIVATGYKQPVEFSSRYDLALYSTTVTYDNGTQRDLRLVPTDSFNEAPVELVSEPLASLGRSSMTQDGHFVLYFTDVTPSGGSLHVVATDGTELMLLPGVVDVVAANGSTIVYSDNSSDPELYPIVADLNVIDLSTETAARLVEAQILDGKNFQLDQAREKIIYTRSGVDRDAEAADHQGLFFRALR